MLGITNVNLDRHGDHLALACGILSLVCLVIGFEATSDAFIWGCIVFEVGAVVFAGAFGSGSWKSNTGVLLALLTFIYWFMAPAVCKVREAALRSDKLNRFKTILTALNDYADRKERRLPPAALLSKKGQPLLSWRVLVLPYLGHKDLYLKFKLDEPWDSESNQSLLRFMPDVYAPPDAAYVDRPPHTTCCQAVVGPGTGFDCPGGCRVPGDFPRGTSDVVVIVEAGIPVPWTKPADFEWGNNLPPLGASGREKNSYFIPQVIFSFCIGRADGSTESVFFSEGEAAIRALREKMLR